ncbi:hypothetical protein TrCOL_g4493 [Triparma columacea]|uniref:MYND-type domain-containing protein n=1 Tax=Triparma columacea TaxID=722753 RepID=A0A9W7L959_9STRA|nr:hypothetical protein TrCOL_g4493 [Triparma columacea]
MSFVHLFCLESWRTRSRHPLAEGGVNCETCSTPYTLPPPNRPTATPHAPGNADGGLGWLNAMPQHVLEAFRSPPRTWVLVSWIVRRRTGRMLAPVVGSPWLAMYCKMRRMLKKRGVSRRRWACTLCRRRARWKCVRCLRSYYCSRECQNVDWHLQHKHLCYKPSRLLQSCCLYLPPIIYLLLPSLKSHFRTTVLLLLVVLPLLFQGVSAMWVGPTANVVKILTDVDLRGRMAEFVTVLSTILLTILARSIMTAAEATREGGGGGGVTRWRGQGVPEQCVIQRSEVGGWMRSRGWGEGWDERAKIFKSWGGVGEAWRKVGGGVLGCWGGLPSMGGRDGRDMRG